MEGELQQLTPQTQELSPVKDYRYRHQGGRGGVEGGGIRVTVKRHGREDDSERQTVTNTEKKSQRKIRDHRGKRRTVGLWLECVESLTD